MQYQGDGEEEYEYEQEELYGSQEEEA